LLEPRPLRPSTTPSLRASFKVNLHFYSFNFGLCLLCAGTTRRMLLSLLTRRPMSLRPRARTARRFVALLSFFKNK
jgi:hypothetical protein